MSDISVKTFRVHVIGPNLLGAADTFHVHAEGCADVRRSRIYASPEFANDKTFVYQVRSLTEISDEVYADIIAENDGDTGADYLQDFKVFTCLADLPDTI